MYGRNQDCYYWLVTLSLRKSDESTTRTSETGKIEGRQLRSGQGQCIPLFFIRWWEIVIG